MKMQVRLLICCLACCLIVLAGRESLGKTIAVAEVRNTAYQGNDKFYGASDDFRNTVAALLSIVLNEVQNVTPMNYDDTRALVSRHIAWSGDVSAMPVSDQQAIEAGKARGLDFVVVATVLEAKVKSSKKSFNTSLFGKRKYSIWNNVDITVYNTADGSVFLKGTYSGQHQKSKKVGYFEEMGRQLGIDELKVSIGKINENALEFAQSDLGIPFTRACEDFADEFANKIGSPVSTLDDAVARLTTAQSIPAAAPETPAAPPPPAPADLKFSVLKVDAGKIMIDAGTNNGLAQGMLLNALRVVVNKDVEKEFPLAKLEVVEVTESMAVAKITEIRKDVTIKPGDRIRPAH